MIIKTLQKRVVLVGIFLVILLTLFSSLSWGRNEGVLRLHFIDVGEGDAILIESPGGESLLVDSGNLVSGYRVVEYLKEKKITKLDYLIFTHPHPDHIGGAFFILQMLKVSRVYDNGEDLGDIAKTQDLYRWYEELVRGKKHYKPLQAGDNISLGNVNLQAHWPPSSLPFSNFNANSLVIMVEYGEFRCLLTGDLITVAEKKLLTQDIDLRADVLKVGHHGAGDASCEEFLEWVSPEIAIISVNHRNIRGYPAGEVIDRFKKKGIRLYRTDRDGDIILSVRQTKSGGFKIKVK